MAFKLRDYQQKGKDLISQRFVAGHNRVMLWAMTGAGKGLWMSDFVHSSIQKNMKVLSVMRRTEIIRQTAKNYKKYHGIDSNVIMGNIKHTNEHLSTVASIDTLRNRIKNPKYEYLRETQIVIIDECHDLTSATYKRLIWWLEGHELSEYDDKKFEEYKASFKKIYIGMTATPFRVGRRTHTFWQSVVKPIEAHELMERGFLVPIKVFAPKKIDTSGLRINKMTGDYDQKEVFERVSKLEVIGDVVDEYRKTSMREFGKLVSCICFCVNQDHSKIMAKAFTDAGIPAIHTDASHSPEERDAAVAGLKSGKYLLLTNCNIFSTGFDAPWIKMESSCRPSDSENLVGQQWGRVLRPYKVCSNCHTELGGDDSCYKCGSTSFYDVKEYAVLLDHANNTSRWGLPYDVRTPELEPIDTARKSSFKGTGVKDCPKCFAVLHANERYCVCGHDFVEASEQASGEIVFEHSKGELHEVNEAFLQEQLYQKIKQKYNSLKRVEMLRGFDGDWKFYKLFDEYGHDFLKMSGKFGMSIKLKNKMKKNELDRGIEEFMGNVKEENDKVYN